MKSVWPALGLLACLGCAADPTTITLIVNADATVPSLSLLDVTIEGNSSGLPATGYFRSPYYDTDAGPPPFYFPTALPVSVPNSVSGPVSLTVQGIDFMTGSLLARGSTTVTVSSGRNAQASVTLTAVVAAPPDGGLTDGGGVDGGVPGAGAVDAGLDAPIDVAIDAAIDVPVADAPFDLATADVPVVPDAGQLDAVDAGSGSDVSNGSGDAGDDTAAAGDVLPTDDGAVDGAGSDAAGSDDGGNDGGALSAPASRERPRAVSRVRPSAR